MEPIFTDKEVRQVLGMYKLNYRDVEGNETLYYTLAKAVRDAVEDKIGNSYSDGKERLYPPYHME